MAYEKNKEESYAINGGVNVKASKYLTERNELLNLVNMNFITVGALTKRDGTTLYLGATVTGQVGGLYEFERLSGASYVIATANTNAYKVTNSFSSFKSGLLNNGIFDFITFTDRLFMGNGQDFFMYDGSATKNYSLPAGISHAAFGVTGIYDATGGLSGTIVAGYGYRDDTGYLGPSSSGVTVSLNGISYNSLLYFGLTYPSGYGVSNIVFYRSAPNSVVMYGTTLISATAGSTSIQNAALGATVNPPYLHFTLAPKYLEIYNNQLFLAGFSSALSTVFWSDIGIPQGVQPQSFAEFRTNDGDRVTGLKAYQQDLIVTKQRSALRLSGEIPENFSIQQITDQYGCLSNRTMVIYQQFLVWLDRKGIIRYNGANIEVISNRVEDYFLRMNVQAAIENAITIHNKQYNEVWFTFPIDGSTKNNVILVYDYISDAWTVYEGISAQSLGIIQGGLTMQTVFYGGYTGTVAYFASDVESDLGQAFTCLVKTRYTTLMGQSVEQQFRRFFLNLDPVVGITQSIDIKLRTNFGETIMATYTMYQAPFQSRIDFGLPAKTLSVEMSHVSATLSLKVFGYTIESRYQRSV